MARCPRCALSVAAYTRCQGCGLLLGFEGLTVLIDFQDSPEFERARQLARRQPSCAEFLEENGHHFLRVTYSFSEMEKFNQLAAAAAGLRLKRTFLNGLEIRWPRAFDTATFYAELSLLSRPEKESSRRAHAELLAP